MKPRQADKNWRSITATRSHSKSSARHGLCALIAATIATAAAIPMVATTNVTANPVYTSTLHRFEVFVVADNLDHPWGMVFLPDGDLLITERPGALRRIHAGQVSPPIDGLPPIYAAGQGGLMDIALHPNFKDNGWIYLTHTSGNRSANGTELTRAVYDGQQLTDLKRLFVALPKSSTSHHFGSRVRFLSDGTLLVTLGERGDRTQAQNLGSHAGTTIRLTDDGQVPTSNPFVSDTKAKPEIYTYGNRNIQGLSIHPQTGLPWAHEHGPQGGDEVNILHAGTNYGWPIATYGRNYITATSIGLGTQIKGTAQPQHYWSPSIAPSGMDFYTGDRFPNWRGDLFIGALKSQMLVRLRLDKEQIVAEERLLQGEFGRIRDVRNAPDGLLYLLTDSSNGKLLRLQPKD